MSTMYGYPSIDMDEADMVTALRNSAEHGFILLTAAHGSAGEEAR
jgi:hypothetical protein